MRCVSGVWAAVLDRPHLIEQCFDLLSRKQCEVPFKEIQGLIIVLYKNKKFGGMQQDQVILREEAEHPTDEFFTFLTPITEGQKSGVSDVEMLRLDTPCLYESVEIVFRQIQSSF